MTPKADTRPTYSCLCPKGRHTYDCYWYDSFIDDMPDPDDYEEQQQRAMDYFAKVENSEAGNLETNSIVKAAVAGFTSGTATYGFCDHTLDRFTLADGTIVYASGYNSSYAPEWTPDLAVYLDGRWRPECIAFHVGWIDYGLPTMTQTDLLKVASIALERARLGDRLEIGCLGGHGRTGSFLAILDMLASKRPNAQRSQHRVRNYYCTQAIETKEQEWYLRCIEAQLLGKPTPPKPKRVTYARSTTVTATATATNGEVDTWPTYTSNTKAEDREYPGTNNTVWKTVNGKWGRYNLDGTPYWDQPKPLPDPKPDVALTASQLADEHFARTKGLTNEQLQDYYRALVTAEREKRSNKQQLELALAERSF